MASNQRLKYGVPNPNPLLINLNNYWSVKRIVADNGQRTADM
ncbi:hypothetical protein AWV72_00754 [Lactiplantibacillus plantarum]|nr:hypothetical protein AWV72_00754 [Lactiplantibacillus plantarum]